MLPCGAYICDILLTRVHSRVTRARHRFTAEKNAPPMGRVPEWKRAQPLSQQRANQPPGLAHHVLPTLQADFAAASMDTRVHSRSRKAGSSKSASLRAEGSPFRTNCAAMSVPRTNFRAGDRVRGAEGFEEIRGFVEAMLVTGQDWAAQDLLVRFDRPVRIFDDEPPTWRYNFEFIDESETAPGLPQGLAYSQSAPPPSLIPAHSDTLLPPTSLADNPRPEPRTGYAKKRCLLRDHRRNMRIMDELIDENGLTSELEERLIEETGNTNFWLGVDSVMDEPSDQEDPEALAKQRVNDLLQESKDKQAFVAAAQDTLACRAVATDLERARMQLEDLRAHALR